jgi:hypothetical protein
MVTEIQLVPGLTKSRLQEFNELFCQAVDELISEILGANVLPSLYDALEKKYAVGRDELPYRLETLYSVLENVFGFRGSRIIENRIIRKFYQNLGLPFGTVDGFSMKDYVDAAREKIGTMNWTSSNSLAKYVSWTFSGLQR